MEGSNRRVWIGCGILLLIVIVGVAVWLIWATSFSPEGKMQAALGPVCSGQANVAAAPFAGTGPHPLFIQSGDGDLHMGWNGQVNETWRPVTVEDIELVACIGEAKEVSIEVCEYIGSNITRYRYETTVRLVEARTGHQVASKVFQGSSPRECNYSERADLTELFGSEIGYSDIEDWLSGFVENSDVLDQPEPKSVSVYCGVQGDSPQYLESNQMASFYWWWGAASEEFRQDYIDSVTFSLRLNGVPIDITRSEQLLDECREGWFCVTWTMPPMTMDPGSNEAVMTVILDREITDGFDTDGDGNLDTYGPSEWVADPACKIIAP